MGRLEEIVERNKHPRKHRQGKFPLGILMSAFVLLILVLMIFTSFGPGPKPKAGEGSGAALDGSAAPLEKGRVRDIGIYVPRKVARDAGTAD